MWLWVASSVEPLLVVEEEVMVDLRLDPVAQSG